MTDVAAVNREYNLLPPPMPDVDLGLVKLRALIGEYADPHQIVCFVNAGAPCSKARARWHRKQQRFYTPQNVLDAQSALARRLRDTVPDRPWTCNVAIVAIFFRPNAQRIDADNLMKLVMDAATEAEVWKDDCQVTAQAAFIELDKQHPRTIIALCPTISTLNRDPVDIRTCQRCGQPFKRDRFRDTGRTLKYCSNACAQAESLSDTRCPKCETVFRRTRAGQRYCSEQCEAAEPRVRRPTGEQRPWPKCMECGGRVSRRDYVRCRNCSPKGRPFGSKNRKPPEEMS